MRNALLLAAALLALGVGAGCDGKAKTAEPSKPEVKSHEYESCASSAQCDGDLRCFDQTCRRTSRSVVGDFYAAAGAAATARGQTAEAIAAYQSALGHYDTEKVPLPPDVDCAYGAALAADTATKDHAALGARVLHRCLLAVPVGSSLRDRALAAAGGLQRAGLDPLALGGAKLADVYLTGEAAPPVDTAPPAGVTVTASPTPTAKTFQAVLDKLAEPDVKAGLVACAGTYKTAAKKDLVTSVGVKSQYVPSQYDDEQGYFALSIDPPGGLPAGTPEAAAETCVRSVVEPAVKATKGVADAFATRLTLAIK